MPWPKGKPFSKEHLEKRTKTLTQNAKRHKKPLIIGGVECWVCGSCGNALPSSDYYADKKAANGLKAQCKQCHTATNVRTRDKDTSRTTNRDHMRRKREQHPDEVRSREREYSRRRLPTEKTRAREMLNRAVRSGRVTRPDACSQCGKVGKVTGHHPDYSQPLAVVWVCYECHGKIHRRVDQ